MKKNTKLFALVGIAAVTVVGGTFAYYNSTQTFSNPFKSSNFSTSAIEKYNLTEGEDWVPGVTVDKEVFATNTGDGEVWVRIGFEEAWSRPEEGKDTVFKAFSLADPKFNPENEDTAGNHQEDTGDGAVATDTGSVVYKKLENVVTDSSKEKGWYRSGEYYYYTSALKKDESTPLLLKEITLCEDADMGAYDELVMYRAYATPPEAFPTYDPEADDADEWQATLSEAEMADAYVYSYTADVLKDGNQGYADADYTLDIKVEFVQADAEAAKGSGWAWHPSAVESTAVQESEENQP